MRAVIVSRLYADPGARGKLRALAAQGCAIAAVVPSEWRSPDGAVRATEFGDDGRARILPVPVRSGGRGDELRWKGAALRRILAEFRPDIVQVEEEPATRVAAQLARASRRLRFRLVAFGWESLPTRTSWVTRFRRTRVLHTAQGVIGGNRLALDMLLRDRPGVPHAVMPQRGVIPPLVADHRPQEEGLSIGFVGRVVPEKGLDLLFRACVRLQGSWRVHVIGSGEAQEELEALAARLGIAARVTWHGALPHSSLDALWPSFDCVVVPSRSTERWVESRGTSALVAMAHGLPVVATATGVLPEVVGEAGLIAPEDDVDGLAAALQRLHDEPGLRAQLGAEGRRRVLADYTDMAIAERTLGFWRAVLAFANS